MPCGKFGRDENPWHAGGAGGVDAQLAVLKDKAAGGIGPHAFRGEQGMRCSATTLTWLRRSPEPVGTLLRMMMPSWSAEYDM